MASILQDLCTGVWQLIITVCVISFGESKTDRVGAKYIGSKAYYFFELGSQHFAFGFFKHVARKVIGGGGGRWGEGILSSCKAETFRTNGK